MAIRIDGKALAAKVKEQVREEAGKLRRRPALAVILVGENPASKVYVAGKEKDCAECGITSFGYKLPEETTQEELLELISRLNSDDGVDGILCQLPLPNGINEIAVMESTCITRGRVRSFDKAREAAEVEVSRLGTLVEKSAPWRSRPTPTDGQVEYAKSLGIPNADYKNKARLSDDISVVIGTRRLTHLINPT